MSVHDDVLDKQGKIELIKLARMLKKWQLIAILLTFFFACSMVVIMDMKMNSGYHDEVTLINNEFQSLGLEPPQWNASTRYFELWDGSTVYVGYTRFNNMDTNYLEVVQFDNCEMVLLGSRTQYVSTDEDTTVLVSREVQRRFTENE